MAGFGALAELDLYHLDLRIGGVGDEFLFAERAVRIAAAEVARGHLPDQIAAMHAVVLADRAFARVVDEAAHLRALVQRLDGIAGQRTKAHGGDIEDAGVIRAGAGGHSFSWLLLRAANPQAEVMRAELGGLQGVVDPLIALLTDVELGAERPVVDLAFGTLIDQRALGARERLGLGIAFDEVLTNLGADEFEDETQMSHDGIVAQNGMLLLQQIPDAQQHQQA